MSLNRSRGPSIRPLRGRLGTGFTLIELMIVVTVMGVLMAIAMPAYQNYVYRTNRAVAKTAVMKIYAQQENYFNDRKAFATSLTQLPDWNASPVYLKKDGGTQTTQGTTTIYKLELKAYSSTNLPSCALSTALTSTSQYAILATPVNAQARDTKCQLLCFGSPGDKGATGTQSSDCWTR